MIKHIWSVLCSSTVTDKDTNNVSLLNVIEQLQVQGAPKIKGSVPIHLELVTLWIKEDPNKSETGNSKIGFVSPSGKIQKEIEIAIDLSKTERARNRVVFGGLTIEESGRYSFVVELRHNDKWHKVSSVPLTVIFLTNEPLQDAEQIREEETK